jgi:hypothetical protein
MMKDVLTSDMKAHVREQLGLVFNENGSVSLPRKPPGLV